MPTSALSAVATIATWSDSRRAEMLSGLTTGVLVVRRAPSRPGPERSCRKSKPGRPRSPRAGRRRLKAEAAQHGPALRTAEQVEEGPPERRLLGRRHDSAGVHNWAIAVVGRAEGLLHALGARRGVGGVDEAGIHLAA